MNNKLVMILFGATGDLAARKLYPSLYRLYKNNYISENFALIGTARSEWSHDHFRSIILDSIKDEIQDPKHADEFVNHCYYQPHDVNDADHYVKLNDLASELEEKFNAGGNRIFYISLAPALYPVISKSLKEQNCLTDHGYNRLIIEKPFGNDYESALELQEQLAKYFDEDQIYRIDHYLGKEIVHSINHFRFSNQIFEQIWDKNSIDHVQISLNESVGIENRGDFYDANGASNDMIQNHVMQLISLVAMDRPEDEDVNALRKSKIEVLKKLHLYKNYEELSNHVVRGQYGPNEKLGYKGYREEDNIKADSITESYFAAKIYIDLPQWEGVPFYVRSGKRMPTKSTTIHIVFKKTAPDLDGNCLTIEVGPELGFSLSFNMKEPGYSKNLENIKLDYKYSPEDVNKMPEDYERLIYECIQGNLSNFAHWEEVAYAWKFIDNIHDLWQEGPEPDFPNYMAGTYGPSEADELLEKDGRSWFNL